MAIKMPNRAKVVPIAFARERLRERPRLRVESANVWTCRESEEITEELLQFHPVFRYWAE